MALPALLLLLTAAGSAPAAACGSIRDWIHAYQTADSDIRRTHAVQDIASACGDYDTRRDDAVLVEILSDGLARGLPRPALQRLFDTYRCLPSQASSATYAELGGLDHSACPGASDLAAWRVVTADHARLRRTAASESAVIGRFMRGNVVVAGAASGDWVAVTGWNGVAGFMHASLLEPFVASDGGSQSGAALLPERATVFAVATEGMYGLVDAAFGRAQKMAADAAAHSGAKAFVLDNMSGTASIDLKQQRVLFRLDLLPDLPPDTMAEHAGGPPENGIVAAIRNARAPRTDRMTAEATMDALLAYHVPVVAGRPSAGSLPPQIQALAYGGELRPLGEGDLRAQWIAGQGDDIEAMLADALKRGAEVYSQGHFEIAFRLVAWTYRTGGIAGFDERAMVLEVRGVPPQAGGTAPLPADVAQAVETLRPLIAAHDWPMLARHYAKDDGMVDIAELQSGAYFHPLFPPLGGGDPAGTWRYSHPFHPDAKLVEAAATGDPAVQRVTMMLEIDQGGGTPQRMLQSFRLRRADGGLLVLPD